MPDGNLNLFQLGARGVNVVTAPTHLTPDELTSAQNAEYISVQGEGGLDQRPGMSRINASPLSSIVAVHDVSTQNISDLSPHLYAGMYTGSASNWRASTDGVTWTGYTTPAKPFSDNTLIEGYFKDIPKVVTIGALMYYVDGASPIAVHSWDGTTDHVLSTVPPAVSGANLNQPTGSLLSLDPEIETPAAGATTYTYKLVAKAGASHSAATTAITTVVGPATLNATNYISINDFNNGATLWPSFIASAGLGVTSFDVYRTVGGATQGLIGNIPVVAGAITRGNGSGASGVEFPSFAGFITGIGSGSGTTYTYKFVYKDGSGHYGAATTGVTLSWNATLDSSNNIQLTNIQLNNDAQTCSSVTADVYRTVGGATQGKIGTITSFPSGIGTLIDTGLTGDGTTPPATGSGLYTGPTQNGFSDGVGNSVFSDAGLTGDGTTPPSSASGTTAGNALAVIDMVTDGNNLFMAVLDQNNSDPTVYGRLLEFNPISESWLQIGLSFPTALGNGSPSCLAFYGGALNYGTYNGITSGSTAYATSTLSPLPAGGIIETHTFASSLTPVCMVEFLGDLYVGLTSLVAATAALVVKRVPVATWSTSLTAVATAALNAYTSLYVYNGRLFAGWTSGGGATAANIYSTPDGITWTLEITLATTDVPCQMVTFKGNLYVVCGKTGVSYNTTSEIYQRTPSGVWTKVDDPSQDFAGCIGIVYY